MSLEKIQSVVKKVKKNLFKKFNNKSFGILKSHLRGLGMEFKEHKQYFHGDDLRFIDWKILARTMNPYVKIFEQERNLEILIVIDASLSMQIGFKEISKLQVAVDITLFLYLFSQKTKYKIHTLIFADKIIDIPRSNGEKGLVYFITVLKNMGILNDEGIMNRSYRPVLLLSEDEKFNYIKKVGLKRKEVILLSDFYNFFPLENCERIISKKNVHAVKIICPLDETSSYPFQVYGKDSKDIHGNKGQLFSGSDNFQLFKKLKKISVNSNYLEDFVREILE